ncbi:MAG: hypothetical protein QY318_00690 [Candidatus Dojkabacteria bacterium]|nr:MAG: hypothetical protein QY318_00690 [Candidatus Dojkabacteria bacterium]
MSVDPIAKSEVSRGDELLEKLEKTVTEIEKVAISTHTEFNNYFLSKDGVNPDLGSYHNQHHILGTVRSIEPISEAMSEHLISELDRYNKLYGTDIKLAHLPSLLKIAAYLHDQGNIFQISIDDSQLPQYIRLSNSNPDAIECQLRNDFSLEIPTYQTIYRAANAEDRGALLAWKRLKELDLTDEHAMFVQRMIMNTKFPFLSQLCEQDGVKGEFPESINKTAPFEIFMKLIDQIGAGWFTENSFNNLLGLVQEGAIEKGLDATLPVFFEYSFIEFLDKQFRKILEPLQLGHAALEELVSRIEDSLANKGGIKGNIQVKRFFESATSIKDQMTRAKTYGEAIKVVTAIFNHNAFPEVRA